jgi:hypothetical protein
MARTLGENAPGLNPGLPVPTATAGVLARLAHTLTGSGARTVHMNTPHTCKRPILITKGRIFQFEAIITDALY